MVYSQIWLNVYWGMIAIGRMKIFIIFMNDDGWFS